MKLVSRLMLALVFIAAADSAVSATAAQSAQSCTLSKRDTSWALRAIANWRVAERRLLRLRRKPLPTMVLFDSQCAVTLRPTDRFTERSHGWTHRGEVALPDGQTLPSGTVSFAAPYGEGNMQAFFVMSLPSVWRAAGTKSALGLEALMDGVFLHELMHSRQFYFANAELGRLTSLYGLPDDLDDDSLQNTFEKDPDYFAVYKAERDLLFAAAATPDIGEVRTKARTALTMMRARHARYFVGRNQQWEPLDRLFLTMEGLGQWLAYSHAKSSRGGGIAPSSALIEIRRGGRFWSQDEGLALFLVIDRLLPGWQRHAFAKEPLMADALLEMALAGR